MLGQQVMSTWCLPRKTGMIEPSLAVRVVLWSGDGIFIFSRFFKAISHLTRSYVATIYNGLYYM